MNIAEQNKKFENATAEEILRWAVSAYRGKIALSSSFGAQSAVLLHMLAQIDKSVPVLFLDTGFLFKETHQFKEEIAKRLGLHVKEFKATPEQIEQTKKKL